MVTRLVDLADVLKIHDAKQARIISLVDALVDGPPTMTLTMDGAATLELVVQDVERTLLRDKALRERCWAEVNGVRFEYVRLNKAGNRFTLQFDDGVYAALKRQTSPLSIPAGSTTRAEAVGRMCREARVKYDVDDSDNTPVRRAVERSAAGGEKTNSWDVLGELAEERHWRRFSDGTSLVVGPDTWLIDRDPHPTTIREFTGPVHEIDFDLDVGRRAATATVSVDAEGWALPPGAVVKVHDEMGPGSGVWLVQEFRWPLTSTRASVQLTRKRHELDEPKRAPGPGDPGDPSFVPGDPGNSNGVAGNAARERMVRFALAQAGDAYVWGGHGPDVWDCSGLVQAATAAGGHALGAPSASQWATCVRAGKTVPVAVGLQTRGALLFRIGVGDYNHVAISLGNGSTVEARGTAYGTGVFGGAAGGGWTGSALWI